MVSKSKQWIDAAYVGVRSGAVNLVCALLPYVRRFVRFLALPYCMVYCVDWQACTRSKRQVLADLLYIFFVHKRFPDNYALCRFWEQDRNDWKYYYGSIYDAYQRARLQNAVQKPEYRIVFDDKEVCYGYCSSLNVPLPQQCATLFPGQDYRAIIARLLNDSEEELIIKPVSGSGGKGVVRAFLDKGAAMVQQDDTVMSLDRYLLPERSVAQRRLRQHPAFKEFGNALTTVRVVTFLTEGGGVVLLGAIIRFSIGNAYVDNVSSGGIYVAVDLQSGKLRDEGYDFKRRRHTHHPDSRATISGLVVPHWPEIVALSETVQLKTGFYRLLGLDIGITESGPVLIEVNPSPDNNCLESACGPLLKDQTILAEFRRSNLLVHAELEEE